MTIESPLRPRVKGSFSLNKLILFICSLCLTIFLFTPTSLVQNVNAQKLASSIPYIPEGWTSTQDPSGFITTYPEGKGSDGIEKVTILQIETSEESPKEIAISEFVPLYEGEMKCNTVIEDTTISYYPAVNVIATCDTFDTKNRLTIIKSSLDPETAYMFQYTAQISQYEKYLPEVDRMIGSFALVPETELFKPGDLDVPN